MLTVGDTATVRLTVNPADVSTAATATAVPPSGGAAVPLSVVSSAGNTEWVALLSLTEAGAWAVTWTVTGTGYGVAYDTVHAFTYGAPTALQAYATPTQYAEFLGTEAPADFDPQSLVRASRRVDRALIGAIYCTDDDDRPTDAKIAAALRDATCAQALFWDEIGDPTGSGAPSEWGEVEIGDVRLRRSGNSRGESGANSPVLCTAAEDYLRAAGLLPINPYGSG